MNNEQKPFEINHLLINSLTQAGFTHCAKGFSQHCHMLDIGTGNPEDYNEYQSPKIVFDIMPLFNRYGFMYWPGDGSTVYTKLQNPAQAIEWARQILSYEPAY